MHEVTAKMGKLSIGPKTPASAGGGLRMVLYPNVHAVYLPIPDACTSYVEYLDKAKGQVRAEFAAFIRSISSAEQTLSGGDITTEDNYFRDGELLLSNGEQCDLKTLGGHLILHERKLFYGNYNKTRQTISFTKGGSWPNECNSWLGNESMSKILDLGYVGECISEFDACNKHLSAKEPSRVLAAIADPRVRQQVDWQSPSQAALARSHVSMNKRQEELARSMRFNVEGVQGPPGTGKSTLIYHLTESFVPSGSVVLCCAVQNKAIDSLAEKFSKR